MNILDELFSGNKKRILEFVQKIMKYDIDVDIKVEHE